MHALGMLGTVLEVFGVFVLDPGSLVLVLCLISCSGFVVSRVCPVDLIKMDPLFVVCFEAIN